MHEVRIKVHIKLLAQESKLGSRTITSGHISLALQTSLMP